MESKLLIGGKSIVDKTTEQERALEERRKQIAEQKVCLWHFMSVYVTFYFNHKLVYKKLVPRWPKFLGALVLCTKSITNLLLVTL